MCLYGIRELASVISGTWSGPLPEKPSIVQATRALCPLQRSSQTGRPPSRTVPSSSLGPPVNDMRSSTVTGVVVVVVVVVVVEVVEVGGVFGFPPSSECLTGGTDHVD